MKKRMFMMKMMRGTDLFAGSDESEDDSEDEPEEKVGRLKGFMENSDDDSGEEDEEDDDDGDDDDDDALPI